MNAKFFAPDGNDLSDVSPSQINELIRTKDDFYWEGGSGDAAIRFPTDKAGQLVFMVRKSLGVFVQYTDPESDKEWVLSKDINTDETVSIIQGGSPWELPRSYFVDQTLAEEIIAEFIKTAQRPKFGTWVPF